MDLGKEIETGSTGPGNYKVGGCREENVRGDEMGIVWERVACCLSVGSWSRGRNESVTGSWHLASACLRSVCQITTASSLSLGLIIIIGFVTESGGLHVQ